MRTVNRIGSLQCLKLHQATRSAWGLGRSPISKFKEALKDTLRSMLLDCFQQLLKIKQRFLYTIFCDFVEILLCFSRDYRVDAEVKIGKSQDLIFSPASLLPHRLLIHITGRNGDVVTHRGKISTELSICPQFRPHGPKAHLLPRFQHWSPEAHRSQAGGLNLPARFLWSRKT